MVEGAAVMQATPTVQSQAGTVQPSAKAPTETINPWCKLIKGFSPKAHEHRAEGGQKPKEKKINTKKTKKTNSKKSRPTPDEMARNRAAQCVQVLLEICELYGFDSRDTSMKNSINVWHNMFRATPQGWLKFAKYALADFAAYWKDDTPSKSPLSEVYPEGCPLAGQKVTWKRGYLLGGKAGRWITLAMKGKLGIDTDSFIQSILRAKGAMPRPDAAELHKAAVETYEKLTTPREAPERVGCATKEKLSDAIKRVVKAITKGQTFSELIKMNPYFPSTNSNYNYSRAEDGGVSAIIELIRRANLDTEESAVKVHNIISKRFGTHTSVVNPSPLYERFGDLWGECRKQAKDEEPKVALVALAEALKVRVISKGPPITYYMLKVIQKLTHGLLRQKRQFKLVGETISASYMMEALEPIEDKRFGKDLIRGVVRPAGQYWLSGDYSAATDNIQGWCSELVANELCDQLKAPDDIRELYVRSLTRHVLEKPLLKKELYQLIKDRQPVPIAEQRSGQLMGSITSFPVLCIINAAVMLCAKEEEKGQRMRFEDLRCAINGDDCAMRVNRVSDLAWEDYGTLAGLTPSVGKVYRSNTQVNMNSTEFRIRPRPYGPEQIGQEYWHSKKRLAALSEEDERIRSLDLEEGMEPHELYGQSFGEIINAGEDKEFTEYLLADDYQSLRWNAAGDDDYLRADAFWLEMVPYINMGLVYGLKRSEGGSKVDAASFKDFGTVYSVGASAHELMAKAPPETRSFTLKLYLNKNWQKLAGTKKVQGGKTIRVGGTSLPWFIPEWAGGLGIPNFFEYPCFAKHQFKRELTSDPLNLPTEVQLRCAKLLTEGKNRVAALVEPTFNSWRMFQLAQREWKRLHLSKRGVPQRAAGAGQSVDVKRLRSLLVVNELFREHKLPNWDREDPEWAPVVKKAMEIYDRNIREMTVKFPDRPNGQCSEEVEALVTRFSDIYGPREWQTDAEYNAILISKCYLRVVSTTSYIRNHFLAELRDAKLPFYEELYKLSEDMESNPLRRAEAENKKCFNNVEGMQRTDIRGFRPTVAERPQQYDAGDIVVNDALSFKEKELQEAVITNDQGDAGDLYRFWEATQSEQPLHGPWTRRENIELDRMNGVINRIHLNNFVNDRVEQKQKAECSLGDNTRQGGGPMATISED